MRLEALPPSSGLEARLAVLARAWPGAVLAIRRESRLGQDIWETIDVTLVNTSDEADVLATELGTLAANFTLVGPVSDASAGGEFSRVVSMKRLSADMLRHLVKVSTVDPGDLRRRVADALNGRSVAELHRLVGPLKMSRYFVWSTFAATPGRRALDPDDVSRDHLDRLGLQLPRGQVVTLWYRLPTGASPLVPTVCDANAGWVDELNECFQPSEVALNHGMTVRCDDHDATDGYPEVVHDSPAMNDVAAFEVWSA